MIATECPTRRALSDYLLGRLNEYEIEAIGQHLENCAGCRREADSLEDIPDSLMARLRGPAPVPQEQTDAQLGELLETAKEFTLSGPRVETDHDPFALPRQLHEYQLLEKIGAGGMGAVYLARHERLDRRVALKVVAPHRVGHPQAIQRFEREMRAIGRLKHENIVAALDAGVAEGVHYIVMELVEGCEAAHLVSRLGPLRTPDACELIRQAALGLHHAHQHGLIHRDVKPSNLLVDREGVVKVTDLGLALLEQLEPDAECTPSCQALGTLDYMAPEQADGGGVGPAADVYSLGGALFKLLTGRAPFADRRFESPVQKLLAHRQAPAPSLRAFRPDAPRDLEAIVRRMLAKDPAQRFATAAAAAQALLPFCEGADLPQCVEQAAGPSSLKEARPASQPSSAPAPSGAIRFRRIAAIAAVSLIAVAVLLHAAGFTVKIRDKAGQIIGEANLPQGTKVNVEENGVTTAVLPGGREIQIAAAEGESNIGSPKAGTNSIPTDKPDSTNPVARSFDPAAARAAQEQWAKQIGAEVEQKNSIGMTLVLIPPGEFDMGSTWADVRQAIAIEENEVPEGFPMHYFIRKVEVEGPQHKVRIPRPFLIAAHEVSVAQWDQFSEESGYKRQALNDPQRHGAAGFGRDRSKSDDGRIPMSMVTWDDANAFCNWLSAKEERSYRLPTEAEWEYACRAGTTTRWFTGDEPQSLRDYAWTLQTCGVTRDSKQENSAIVPPRPVGQKKPNPFGLYDMTGNVWEWCRDNFRQDYYQYSPAENPPGPDMLITGPFNKTKVLRGGGNGFRENETRSASRWWYPPHTAKEYLGFRVVCEMPAP